MQPDPEQIADEDDLQQAEDEAFTSELQNEAERSDHETDAEPEAPSFEPAYAATEPTQEEVETAWRSDSPGADDEFAPFGPRDYVDEPRKSRLLPILILVILVAAAAAAFWFLAPAEWKARVGLAQAETPLQLMMTHSDRQPLESGNELLAVTGRVINPTDKVQRVPPIQAQLRSRSGQVVYSWTIAPPAARLEPRESATFNSAEVNVPAGGDQLTITLGPPSA
jgi:hypothetical protein